MRVNILTHSDSEQVVAILTEVVVQESHTRGTTPISGRLQ